MKTLKNSLTGYIAKCSTEQTGKPLCLVGVLFYLKIQELEKIDWEKVFAENK